MDFLFYKKMLETDGKTLTVLCAEDDKAARENMQQLLQNYFAKVDVAENGLEALYLYKKNHYDIVITDINMPQMDGIELAQNIKDINENQQIIVISAYNDSEYLIELIEIGVDGFVLKPINRMKLVKQLFKVQKYILDERMLEDFHNQLIDLNVKLDKKNDALNASLKAQMKQENKTVALLNKVQQETPWEDLEFFKNTRTNTMSAREFLETYPVDMEQRVMSLEKVVDILDLQVNKLSSHISVQALKEIADTFTSCSEVIYGIGEFNNLAYAMESISITLLELESLEKVNILKNLLFEINTNLEKWMRLIFIEHSATDIHYLDDSFINDAVMIEQIVANPEKKATKESNSSDGDIMFL